MNTVPCRQSISPSPRDVSAMTTAQFTPSTFNTFIATFPQYPCDLNSPQPTTVATRYNDTFARTGRNRKIRGCDIQSVASTYGRRYIDRQPNNASTYVDVTRMHHCRLCSRGHGEAMQQGRV
jgi:hypothetical protein